MKRATIELELPEELIQEAQVIARGGDRSLESVLQDGLAMIFGMMTDSDDASDLLHGLSDQQLWELFNRPLPWAQDSRLRELTARGKRGALLDHESRELNELLDMLDRQILLRSRALLQMKRRGLDVDSYLGV